MNRVLGLIRLEGDKFSEIWDRASAGRCASWQKVWAGLQACSRSVRFWDPALVTGEIFHTAKQNIHCNLCSTHHGEHGLDTLKLFPSWNKGLADTTWCCDFVPVLALLPFYGSSSVIRVSRSIICCRDNRKLVIFMMISNHVQKNIASSCSDIDYFLLFGEARSWIRYFKLVAEKILGFPPPFSLPSLLQLLFPV